MPRKLCIKLKEMHLGQTFHRRYSSRSIMKTLMVLFLLYATSDATLLTLLRKKLGLLFPPRPAPIYQPIAPVPIFHPITSAPNYHPISPITHPGNLHPVPVNIPENIYPPKYEQNPVIYTIIPTGVTGPAVTHSETVIPGENSAPLPLGNNYNLVHGPGAVLNINTRSKDGWGYALQPIPNSHHPVPVPDKSVTRYITHFPEGETVEQDIIDWNPAVSEEIFSNAPLYFPEFNDDDNTKAIFTVNEEDGSKFESSNFVEGHDNNEYHRTYTLKDGTIVTENGRLITQPDGGVVFIKYGQYQYKRDDGELVTVKWEADENGFRIIN